MIFIGGYTASGKTTLAKMLSKDGYLSIDVKDVSGFIGMLSQSEYKLGSTISENVLGDHEATVNIIKSNHKKELHKDVVISGLRNIESINLLVRLLSMNAELKDLLNSMDIVYMETDIETLKQRFEDRNENSKSTFEDSIKKDNLSGVKTIEANADISIDNNGSIEETYEKLVSKLKEAGQ